MARPHFFLLLAFVAASAAPADIRLDFQVVEEGKRHTTQKLYRSESRRQIWLGANRARLDLPTNTSYVLDSEQQRMWIVDHSARTYEVLDLPVRLKKLLRGDLAFGYELLQAQMRPEVRLGSHRAGERIDQWTVDRFHWVITTETRYARIDYSAWVTDDPRIDEALYESLRASVQALDVLVNAWIAKTLTSPGIAVRTELEVDDGHFYRKDVESLKSITEHEAEPRRYGPPAMYREVEFNAARFLAFDR